MNAIHAPHVLIVDDDVRIRTLLIQYLQSNGYVISSAANLGDLRKQLTTFSFDLIILDIMLPDGSGLEFIQQNQVQTPIILLTAMGQVDDRINGLESGAEDYIAKPFEPKELLLRINKILHRRKLHADKIRWCRFGDFRLNIENNALFLNNKPVQLTTMESNILAILAQNVNHTISREQIAECSPGINIRTIDAQVARVRTKIEIDPRNPIHLHTVRGKGYVLWGNIFEDYLVD